MKYVTRDDITAGWLASQFSTMQQLRAYLQLSREERCACFPDLKLHRLTDAQWASVGLNALKQLAAMSPN